MCADCRILGDSVKFFILLLSGIFCFGSGLFAPIEVPEFDKKKAELGKKIYFETKFNPQKISCDSCHNIYLNQSGTSKTKNTPTILNSALSTIFSQDRSIKNLNEKLKRSFQNRFELNTHQDAVVSIIKRNSHYVSEFNALYDDGVNFENVVDALENFVKTLVTPNSKFDKFLRKEYELSKDEQEGFSIFLDRGCASCHNGVNLGSNNYQYTLNKKTFIKVPTLRNLSKTAPYFGDTQNLATAIEKMSVEKVNMPLQPHEIEKIIIFLQTLDGELP